MSKITKIMEELFNERFNPDGLHTLRFVILGTKNIQKTDELLKPFMVYRDIETEFKKTMVVDDGISTSECLYEIVGSDDTNETKSLLNSILKTLKKNKITPSHTSVI